MFEILKEQFPQIETNGCLQSLTDAEFYIYDHNIENRCYVHQDPEGIKHFTVKNIDEHTVHFLAIDKCMLMDSELTQRCDCAIFDDHTFCFIEIKTTSSNNDRRKAKSRKKAFDQLQATIDYFKTKIDFEAIRIEAYITLIIENILEEDEITELRPKPRIRANLTEKIAEFDQIGVELFYENRKHFL